MCRSVEVLLSLNWLAKHVNPANSGSLITCIAICAPSQAQKHKLEAKLNVTNANFTELQLKSQSSDLKAQSRISELESAVRDLTAQVGHHRHVPRVLDCATQCMKLISLVLFFQQVSSARAENDMLKRRVVDLETDQARRDSRTILRRVWLAHDCSFLTS